MFMYKVIRYCKKLTEYSSFNWIIRIILAIKLWGFFSKIFFIPTSVVSVLEDLCMLGFDSLCLSQQLYGHVQTVSSPNRTFSWASLNK